MSVCIALRDDYDSVQLRTLAKASRDPRQVRRLLALAAVYDGMTAGVLSGTSIETRALKGRNVSRQIGLVWRKTSGREREFRLLGESLKDAIHSV